MSTYVKLSCFKLYELLPGDLWISPSHEGASLVLHVSSRSIIVLICWSAAGNSGILSDFGDDMGRQCAGYIIRELTDVR